MVSFYSLRAPELKVRLVIMRVGLSEPWVHFTACAQLRRRQPQATVTRTRSLIRQNPIDMHVRMTGIVDFALKNRRKRNFMATVTS